MAFAISDTFHYAPKVPPESDCACYFQQLPYCFCDDWIKAGTSETAHLAVPSSTSSSYFSSAEEESEAVTIPSLLPPQQHYHAATFFSELLFGVDHHHHHPLLDPGPSPLPWPAGYPAAAAAASTDGSADFSSSGAGSPAAAASLGESPENYALSPASTTFFAWPGNSGYGELYSPSPLPVENT